MLPVNLGRLGAEPRRCFAKGQALGRLHDGQARHAVRFHEPHRDGAAAGTRGFQRAHDQGLPQPGQADLGGSQAHHRKKEGGIEHAGRLGRTHEPQVSGTTAQKPRARDGRAGRVLLWRRGKQTEEAASQVFFFVVLVFILVVEQQQWFVIVDVVREGS